MLRDVPPEGLTTTIGTGATGGYTRDIAAVDLNSDGLPDIITCDHTSGNRIYLGRADASDTDILQRPADIVLASSSCYGFDFGDMNADGRLDIIEAVRTNSTRCRCALSRRLVGAPDSLSQMRSWLRAQSSR